MVEQNKYRRIWDERYQSADYVFGTQPNDYLVACADRIPSAGKVLCLGDGEGRNGVWLAEQGHDVWSVDLSEVGLDKARSLATEHVVSLHTIVADLGSWVDTVDAAGPWDGVVSIFCHLEPEVRRHIGNQLAGRLTTAGILIIESYTPDQIGRGTGGPSGAAVMLTPALVRGDWPGLDLTIAEMQRSVVEGLGHNGEASVLQVLGRRPARA